MTTTYGLKDRHRISSNMQLLRFLFYKSSSRGNRSLIGISWTYLSATNKTRILLGDGHEQTEQS